MFNKKIAYSNKMPAVKESMVVTREQAERILRAEGWPEPSLACLFRFEPIPDRIQSGDTMLIILPKASEGQPAPEQAGVMP